MNWSGGKDSALALYKVLQNKKYDVISLLTTINSDKSAIHEIPISLLQKQADSIGIPLYTIDLDSDNYEDAMKKAALHFIKQDATHFIFGDIHLFDIKTYREERLNPYGITVIEPLWGKTSEEVMQEFLQSGIQTVVITTMPDKLDKSFVGRIINKDFVKDLPSTIDICGENGEYHTFTYAGNLFQHTVSFTLGETKELIRSINLDNGTTQDFGYWYADLQE